MRSLGGAWPLTCRGRELRRIGTALDATGGVLLAGAAGVGKTRLARAAVSDRDAAWVIATDSARHIPLGAFTSLLGTFPGGLSLDEREVFIWEQLDGERSIRELLFAHLERFGELALPRIEAAVRTFADAELVRGLPDHNPPPTGWQRFGRFVVRNLIRVQLSIGNLDPLVERAYRAFAWRLSTPRRRAALGARHRRRVRIRRRHRVAAAVRPRRRRPGRGRDRAGRLPRGHRGARGGARVRRQIIRQAGQPRGLHADEGVPVRLTRHQRHVVRHPVLAICSATASPSRCAPCWSSRSSVCWSSRSGTGRSARSPPAGPPPSRPARPRRPGNRRPDETRGWAAARLTGRGSGVGAGDGELV